MMPGAAEKPSTTASTLVAQYETLRTAVLGEALPLEARSGLMLFLRRGMWSWARSLSGESARQELLPVPRSAAVEPGERSTIVYVLAAMARKFNTRGTP
jgi:hypothetical protein